MKKVIFFVIFWFYAMSFSTVDSNWVSKASPPNFGLDQPKLKEPLQQQSNTQPEQRRRLTDKEKEEFWKGQPVILLNPAPTKYDVEKRAKDTCFGFRRYGKPREDALFKEYTGKTGTILEVVTETKTASNNKLSNF